MDEKALIILAEMLDKARIQANAIEATASQETGVYGHVVNGLHQTLALLTDSYQASRIYEAMLDGNSVKEALAIVGKERI